MAGMAIPYATRTIHALGIKKASSAIHIAVDLEIRESLNDRVILAYHCRIRIAADLIYDLAIVFSLSVFINLQNVA